jgi:hypothetical protein
MIPSHGIIYPTQARNFMIGHGASRPDDILINSMYYPTDI